MAVRRDIAHRPKGDHGEAERSRNDQRGLEHAEVRKHRWVRRIDNRSR
ncbi:MAG: hypothetical protein K8R59_10360 [Thermoanaerobaculales bacterium]|nr:hypothetical protein [Thermoanaerobaculales bacterium]